MNRNVRNSYIFTSLQSFGRGIWMGNILSLYIVLFSEQANGFFGLTSNELLGITAGISGISMTLIVFPAGVLADKFSRAKILKISGFLGFIAMSYLALSSNIYMIMVSLFLWGAFQGLSRPAFDSILADSLPTGNRSETYSRIHFVQQAAMAIGPFMNIFLFYILGDVWDIAILKIVLLFGLSFSLLSTIILFFFSDDETMGHESESPEDFSNINNTIIATKKIPILLVTSNVIIGMGAGMTVKFFPVFFKSIYQFSPVNVQLIMGATLLITGITGILAQKLSKSRGRAKMIFFVQFSSIICLVGIAFYPPLLLLLPLFVLRGSLMNAAHPLSRSILMDVIPKRNRGKWNSLETIAWGLFWNASAAIGGFLIGDDNFKRCFLITAAIYFVGTIPIFYLIPLVKKET